MITIFTFRKTSIISLLAAAGTSMAIHAATDPFVFCTKNCTSPGPCDTQSTQLECVKTCTTEVWKNVAAAELKDTSEEFRKEKDPSQKEKMLHGTKIAKCLGLDTVDNPSPLLPASGKSTRNDLCMAAIKAHQDNFGDVPAHVGTVR